MKKATLLIAAAAVALMAMPALATADTTDWTGLYVGASANNVDADTFNDTTGGLFIGYRQDYGNVVSGVEVGVSDINDDGLSYIDISVGYDFGDVLAYAAVGYGDTNFDDGVTGSIGADYQFDNGVFIGAKYTRVDFVSTDLFSIRVGYSF